MSDHALTSLSAPAAQLARAASRPRRVAISCIFLLTALGWSALALMSVDSGSPWAAICHQGWAGEITVAGVALLAGMWVAMTLAMMIPSAAPTILTYAEIADTAARKGDAIVSPFVLTAGYIAVWLGFALAIAIIQATAGQLAGDGNPAVSRIVTGLIFAGAGLYQFSALKHACLHQCRHPFQFFFTNWKTTARGVFGLGIRQGLFCLGCCWAAMTVMAALGVMNIVWMVMLGIVMIVEKLAAGRWPSYAIGMGLIAIGFGFMVLGTTGNF
jgi:predicted metal-binding membrane protein